MFVTVNGKILQCERISHNFSLGQMHEDRVELDFDAVAKLHNNRISYYDEQCKKCHKYERCPVCVLNEIGRYEHCRNQTNAQMQKEYTEKMSSSIRNHPDWYDSIMHYVFILR